jgi:hypothetical protein
VPHRRRLFLFWVLGAGSLLHSIPGGALAQAPPPLSPPATPAQAAWDAPEARALLELGREARSRQIGDGSLWSYTALTEGHIYFYVDSDEGDQALIRVDQVAVELSWEAPDVVRQRIVGERSETRLPVRDFRYYLDRLTLVQYGFGDEIEVGSGMDVARVPHPLADPPRGEAYRVRLGDGVTLRVPGIDDPIRVRELHVEPVNPGLPGVIGTLFLDEADGQLVRFSMGFTPASYQDPRTDRIVVTLDYGLWEGRYWLPNRQELEVRREIPEFDVGVGTIIRAVLRVGEYQLNAPVSPFLRDLPSVTALPLAERRAFQFREGLYDALSRDGMDGVRTRVDPGDLRRELESRVARAVLPSGLSPVRLYVAGASDALEASRARGVSVGMGASWRPEPGVRLRTHLGYAGAAERPTLRIEGDRIPPVASGPAWGGDLFLNAVGDLGLAPAMPGVFSSLSALLVGEDYRDPWQRSGARMRASLPPGAIARHLEGDGAALALLYRLTADVRFDGAIGVEVHRSEVLRWEEAPGRLSFLSDPDAGARPVLPITEGTFFIVDLGGSRRSAGTLPGGLERIVPGFGSWTVVGGVEVLAGSPGTGVRLRGELSHSRTPVTGHWDAEFMLRGGGQAGARLAQQTTLLGGRETLPGFPFRALAPDRWALLSLEGSRDLIPGSPWVRLRAGGGGAWMDGTFRGRASAGVGLYYNILRIEGARGWGELGESQLLISIDPLWWRWL